MLKLAFLPNVAYPYVPFQSIFEHSAACRNKVTNTTKQQAIGNKKVKTIKLDVDNNSLFNINEIP